MELMNGKTSQNFNSKYTHLYDITDGREEYFVTTCINKIFIKTWLITKFLEKVHPPNFW